MSKKKNKKMDIIHISSIENTLRQMPKYNAHAYGHGVFEDKKGKHASRTRKKAQLRKELSKTTY